MEGIYDWYQFYKSEIQDKFGNSKLGKENYITTEIERLKRIAIKQIMGVQDTAKLLAIVDILNDQNV